MNLPGFLLDFPLLRLFAKKTKASGVEQHLIEKDYS
jgi:hypothetical protein